MFWVSRIPSHRNQSGSVTEKLESEWRGAGIRMGMVWFTSSLFLQDIMSEEHDKMFSSLLGFIQSAQVQLETLHKNDVASSKTGSDCSSLSFLPARLEIPSVALMAGEEGWVGREGEDKTKVAPNGLSFICLHIRSEHARPRCSLCSAETEST